jgi:hypothetical protein
VLSPQCLRESQHEKCTRRGSGGEHNSCHCQSPVQTQPSLSHAELWCIVFRTAKYRTVVSTDLSARGATACATHASQLAELFQLQPRGLEASSTASGGALGCLPARLLLPRPPGRDHSSSAAVLVRVVFSLSSLLACQPAAATDRTGSQPATASINQHYPSWSTLTAALAPAAPRITTCRPLAMGHGHRPSPHRPSCQTAAGPPERLTNVRATEAVSRRRQDGRRRAQGHNTNRSIVGRPVPLWSWTRYCLMNREAGVVLLSRPRPPERGAGTESSNH